MQGGRASSLERQIAAKGRDRNAYPVWEHRSFLYISTPLTWAGEVALPLPGAGREPIAYDYDDENISHGSCARDPDGPCSNRAHAGL